MKRYAIASIAGDGIGGEVEAAGIRVLEAALTAVQGTGGQAVMGGLHEVMPQAGRGAAAGNIIHGPGVVVADPDGGHQISGVADKPGVAGLLTGAGLAGRRARQLRGAAGTVGDHR